MTGYIAHDGKFIMSLGRSEAETRENLHSKIVSAAKGDPDVLATESSYTIDKCTEALYRRVGSSGGDVAYLRLGSGLWGTDDEAEDPYLDAIMSLVGDPRVSALDLTNQRAAIDTIKGWLLESLDDQLTAYAEKIYNQVRINRSISTD
jgi:hypothetical protein